MNGSNLAEATTSDRNLLEEFAKLGGQSCWQNPAYKSSRYITRVSESSERMWVISITHTDTLYNEVCVQPFVTHHEGHGGIIQEATDTITIEKEVLDLQRFIQARQIEAEEESWDIETRLIPPPMSSRRIKVKFRFIGKEAPRIFFDPDRD